MFTGEISHLQKAWCFLKEFTESIPDSSVRQIIFRVWVAVALTNRWGNGSKHCNSNPWNSTSLLNHGLPWPCDHDCPRDTVLLAFTQHFFMTAHELMCVNDRTTYQKHRASFHGKHSRFHEAAKTVKVKVDLDTRLVAVDAFVWLTYFTHVSLWFWYYVCILECVVQ